MLRKLYTKIVAIGILMGAFLLLSQKSHCQQDTTIIVADSAILSSDYLENDFDLSDQYYQRQISRSPRVAALSSAILPGLGQAYNGKFFKIPVIYGGGMLIYYYYDRYNFDFRRIQRAIDQIENGQEVTDPTLQDWSVNNLKNSRNNIGLRRDYQIVYLGLLYLANVIDAMVDAYLIDYDISRDLSMRVNPTMIPPSPDSYIATCGLKLSFKF